LYGFACNLFDSLTIWKKMGAKQEWKTWGKARESGRGRTKASNATVANC